jgi:hypothetical protein
MAEKDKKPKQLHVVVNAARSPEAKEFTWDPELLVAQAADEVAEAFGYAPGTPTLSLKGTTLERDKTLAASGIKNGDKLELVDIGGGV